MINTHAVEEKLVWWRDIHQSTDKTQVHSSSSASTLQLPVIQRMASMSCKLAECVR